MTNEELIGLAAEVLNPKKLGDSQFGQVGTALVTNRGNIFRGVCIDTSSGLGFCAERTAISQMITSQEYKIKKIVAVWNDSSKKQLHILPPCGVCRQYMFLVSENPLEIEVVITKEKTVKLKDLLPYHRWPEPLA